MAVLGTLVCAVLTSCGRSTGQKPDTKLVQRANTTLSKVELPVLPEGITDLHYWAGGIFAKFINIKFTASRDQALDYFKRAGAPCYFEFEVREDKRPGDKYRFSATHSLTQDPVQTKPPVSFELNYGNGLALKRWFDSVYQIRHGWYYGPRKKEDGNWGSELYYDLDTQVLYLYWHYS